MPRLIRPLPPEITNIIFMAGNRKVVLVEGDDDEYAFRTWYEERLRDVYFHAADSTAHVVAYVAEALRSGTKGHVYGIVDRDYRTDEEAVAWKSDPDTHLLSLWRYEIENYLLEAGALATLLNETYGRKLDAPDVDAIEAQLLEACGELSVKSAANWVISDFGRGEFLGVGYPADRSLILTHLSKELNISDAEADANLAAKEALIEACLSDMVRAHTVIRGKYLLHYLYRVNVHPRMQIDVFTNLLVASVKRYGIPQDIRDIIENRVLG
ncbi:MAG TPA: DUF4435 domain-containing protein [Capsulimonadaceae bacterium]|jgi:hypothetical protein